MIRPSDINWPNTLCVMRFVGSLALPPLGWYGEANVFIGLLIVLLLIDWLDGKIAVWFEQQSEQGAKLDTYADVFMYALLALGAWWLNPTIYETQWPFALAAGMSYGASVLAGMVRFRRPPSYHTRLAKTCWLLIGIGAVTALWDAAMWPLSVALVMVAVTNLEAIGITCVLDRRRSDVPSIFHAMKLASSPDEGAPTQSTDSESPRPDRSK